VEPGEEDVDIKEVKQQLKKAQHVIAQFYQENRELRRQLAERIPETQASQSVMFPSQDARNISFSLIFKCFLVVAFRQTLCSLKSHELRWGLI
jgi:hypothetical protein